MNEKQINNMLKQARELAETFYKKGKKEIGEKVLQLASTRALDLLQDVEIRGIFQCQCGKKLTYGQEIEFYRNSNTCYDCDHAYQDYLEEYMYE